METQNYSNHRRIHPLYHYFLSLAVAFALGLSIVKLWKTVQSGQNITDALLLFVIAVSLSVFFILVRSYAAKVQDRAIRAEENLRHFVLTGSLLPSSLSVKQIIALRFAGHDQFPELARKAAEDGMAPDEIKKSVKDWREDEYRI